MLIYRFLGALARWWPVRWGALYAQPQSLGRDKICSPRCTPHARPVIPETLPRPLPLLQVDFRCVQRARCWLIRTEAPGYSRAGHIRSCTGTRGAAWRSEAEYASQSDKFDETLNDNDRGGRIRHLSFRPHPRARGRGCNKR